jgi:hypothetical protein
MRHKLDFVVVVQQPILDGLGVMDAQIVDNEKDRLLRVLDETLQKNPVYARRLASSMRLSGL